MIKKNENESYKVFNYGEGIVDLAWDILDRVEEDSDDVYDAISEAIDSGLIYYSQQWTLIEYYFSPLDENISLNEAIGCFVEDLAKCVEEV